ncbi:hypothetical protein SAMN06295998_1261, partial [Primorskyibacter flagellatus]
LILSVHEGKNVSRMSRAPHRKRNTNGAETAHTLQPPAIKT